jgi:hypothetical protein
MTAILLCQTEFDNNSPRSIYVNILRVYYAKSKVLGNVIGDPMETMKSQYSANIPLVRAVPEAPGLYIRARREDKTPLLELFASGITNLSGIVFDPSRVRQDKELRDAALIR